MTRLGTPRSNGESGAREDRVNATVGQKVRAAVAARLGATPGAAAPRYLVGLVGRGIGLSKSPAMHEREGARMGLSYAYVLLDFDQMGLDDADLSAVIEAARGAGFAGFNVTHPFKQAVIAHLGDLSPEAAAIGAVNTVLLGARAIGHNTDSWGFAESFAETLGDVRTARILQFGAGGAGAAVAHALLAHQGGRLTISDLDAAKAEALARRLVERFGPRVAVSSADEAIADADGVVNTTPMGMAKYPGLPLARELLTPRHWVADIVYFPADTALLQLARQLGCRTMAGTGMAVYQAVKAFELFTGIAPDRDRMIDHFKAAA
jgi:shikimate dehydrogenase